MNRRNFLSTMSQATALLALGAGSSALAADPTTGKVTLLAKPTPEQLAFMDMEVGSFHHFGLNCWDGLDSGNGQTPPSVFNPTELNVEQWILAAKSMGAKYAVLTARHEGGFCLWPTKTTEYSIANSPFQNGKGDLVRDFVDACRKHGLKPGLYHTAKFDAHEVFRNYKGKLDPALFNGPRWGKLMDQVFKESGKEFYDHFQKVQVQQMTELLSNYGEITYVWVDHWNGVEPIWRSVTEVMRRLQPHCLMMGPDVWLPGNELGRVLYPYWNATNTFDDTIWSRPAPNPSDVPLTNDYGLLEKNVLPGNRFGKFWRSQECTNYKGFYEGSWFWHPKGHPFSPKVRSLGEHVDLYYRTVGLGANTIINLPPDIRGLVPEDMVVAAKAFGDEIQARFAHPIAILNEVATGDTVELAWSELALINTVVTMENIVNGQKIARYTLEAMVNGQWQPLKPVNFFKAPKPFNTAPGYETIGHKKIDRVEPVTTKRIRFRCLESVEQPAEIRSLAVFNCPPFPAK